MRLQLNRNHRVSISAHDGAKSNQSKIVAKHRHQAAQHHTVDDLATAAVPPSAVNAALQAAAKSACFVAVRTKPSVNPTGYFRLLCIEFSLSSSTG
jgi:cell division septation protein DedD